MIKRKLPAFIALLTLMCFQHCGDLTSPTGEYSSVNFSVSARKITSLSQAMTIYQRLGTKISVESPEMGKMIGFVESGRILEAAEFAARNDNFFNVVVRDFAAKMSNREETVTNPLNDFTATVIGIARDNLDAREMLTGNYFYWAPNAAITNKTLDAHVVRSNAHYEELDTAHINLAQQLVKNETQMIVGNGGTTVPMTDAAGVLTSRAFLSSHAIAGTNRRLVEFSFSQFLCAPIEDWANTDTPDGFVGRDIGRSPADLYKSRCVGCHAPMDAMRPAFAYVNFVNSGSTGFAQYKQVVSADPRDNQPDVVDVPVAANEQLVPSKFRRNKYIFADGFAVASDSWENYTSDKFGWRSGSNRGSGMKAFGRMLSDSRRFSECMVRRIYKTVCYKDIPAERPDILSDLTRSFEESGYRLRPLFARAVSLPECTGDEGQ